MIVTVDTVYKKTIKEEYEMEEQLKTTGKRKIITIALCAVLVLTLGVGSAFAATGGDFGQFFKAEDGNPSYSVDGGNTWIEGIPDNMNTKYSLDGGKTWNDGLPPEGIGDNVMVTSSDGEIPDEHEVIGVDVMNEDGVQKYSTDGGKTWSEDVPDGVTVSGENSIIYSVTVEE